MTQRRVPRWSQLRPLLQGPPRTPGASARRLQRAASIDDLREQARRRVPRAVFDYTDGGAGREVSLRRSREAFDRVEFAPSTLRDVSSVDTSTTLLGGPAAMPLVLAPTGFTRMMHHEGEVGVARAAARAAAAGYEALVLTVDTPVGGLRLRDVRNGMTIPPRLTARTVLDGARHPSWWVNLLTTEPLEFASLRFFSGTVSELVAHVFDPTATLGDLRWLREQWAGPLVVKGIVTVDDALASVDAGADALVVSNHGGRQLDRAATPLEVLSDIVRAVGGRAEVYVDGGVLSGADVAAAVGLGARAALVGRAYLYGLMAGGEAGVDRALEILRRELLTTMQLVGVTSVGELAKDRVRLR
jgi:L-lactate dehydrogenase (cytochrome)